MVGFDPAGWWLSVDPMLSNYEFPSHTDPHHKPLASLGNWGRPLGRESRPNLRTSSSQL